MTSRHAGRSRRVGGRGQSVGAGVAVAALVAGLTACGGEPGGGAHSLTMLAVQDSTALDPFHAGLPALVDGPRMSALYDPLFYVDPAAGKVTPHLGESLTSADGGATWTMKLRPNVRFSDGTPFDAAAVKINYDTHANPETRSAQRGTAAMIRTAVRDPLTLSITSVGAPNPKLDMAIATYLPYIEAPSALAKGPQEYGNTPVGAGPFVLQSWTRGSQQVFVKNPDYWQKDKGLPTVEKLVVTTLADTRQQYNTVASGQADFFPASDSRLLDRAAKDLKAETIGVSGGQGMQFNVAKPPFDDPRARRAVALAVDPVEMSRTLAAGEPAQSLFNRVSPFFDPTATQPASDKAEAQRLFDELAAEGKRLDFRYIIPQNPAAVTAAEYVQSRLGAFRNVAMKTEPVEIGVFITKIWVNKDFQAVLTQPTFGDPEPNLFNMLYSRSPQNITGWNNPDADRALLAGRDSSDPAVRERAYRDLQKTLAADLPLWLYTQASVGVIHAPRITNVQLYNDGTPLMDRIDVR